MKNIVEIEIGMSPATRVAQEVFPVNVVTMTYGGGMGGTNVTFYLPGHDFINWVDDMAIVDPVTSSKLKLYKNYVVHEIFRYMAYQRIDHTAHVNYHKKVCNKAIREEWILLPVTADPERVQFVENRSPNSQYGQLPREISRNYKE